MKALQGQLERKSPDECIGAYETQLQQNHRNVLAVTESTQSRNSVLWIESSSPENSTSSAWTCMYTWKGRNMTTDTWEKWNETSRKTDRKILADSRPTCSTKAAQGNSSTWPVGYHEAIADGDVRILTSYPISYCLVESDSQVTCSLRTIPQLLIAVIIANTVKFLAMLVMLHFKQPTLVTIGDGVASFLENPDSTTEGMCLANYADFYESTHPNRRPWDPHLRVYIQSKPYRRWFASSSGAQWMLMLML